jgi:hypothetical protein
VQFQGTGNGSVSVSSQGPFPPTNCTTSCSVPVTTGAAIQVEAAPNLNNTFGGWSGACSADPCLLTMTSNQTVIATFNAVAPDFSISASALSPGSVNPGLSATSTIDVTAVGGFNGLVTFACSVSPTPQLAPQCFINPSSVSPGTQATLTITTAGPLAGLAFSSGGLGRLYALWLPMCGFTLVVMALPARRKRMKLPGVVTCGLLFASVLVLTACNSNGSSHGSSGTPPGPYSITVTGQSGSMQHPITLTLTVR